MGDDLRQVAIPDLRAAAQGVVVVDEVGRGGAGQGRRADGHAGHAAQSVIVGGFHRVSGRGGRREPAPAIVAVGRFVVIRVKAANVGCRGIGYAREVEILVVGRVLAAGADVLAGQRLHAADRFAAVGRAAGQV